MTTLEKKSKKDVEYYMNLPYAMEICQIPKEEGGGIFISIPMLKGGVNQPEIV